MTTMADLHLIVEQVTGMYTYEDYPLFNDLVVPLSIAKCPECGEPVCVNVHEWESETGVPTKGGYILICRTGEEDHAHSYSDWIPVEQKVYEWMVKAYSRTPETSTGS